jgi:hypothetical protein
MLRQILLSSSISLIAACASGPAPAPPPSPSLVLTWSAPTANTDGTSIAGALTYGVYIGACGHESRAAIVSAPQYALPSGNLCAYVTAIEGSTESAPSAAIAF